MATVAGYVRVSTDTQKENGLGAAIQREQIADYCQEHGHELVGVWEDLGVSGATMPAEREGLRALLRQVEVDGIELVVVAKLDRMARDLAVQLWCEKELLRAGVELVSIGEPWRGDDPMTKAMLQIVAVFAELEKNVLVQRMARGRMAKRKLGGYAGGQMIPLGLEVQGRGKEARFVPDGQAGLVRRVFHEYAEGTSMGVLADRLTAEGIRGKRGGRMGTQTVALILHNDLYVHHGVVSRELFDFCQERAAGAPGRAGSGCSST